MKRSLYDSEYERVRRQAGLARPEFPEERRPGEVGEPQMLDEDTRERMAALAEQEAAKAAESKARADALTLRSNELVRLKEYERAGVRPVPGISLALALSMGWKVQQVGGENVLVAPPPPKDPKEKPRMTREEHADAQSAQSLKDSF